MGSIDIPVRSRHAAAWVSLVAVLSLGVVSVWFRTDEHKLLQAGDLIRFEPSAMPAPQAESKLLVHRVGSFGCVLDLDILRQSGGSLLIEGTMDGVPDTWHLHWAGLRTSRDTANCGASAELILSTAEIQRLSAAAGAKRVLGAGR